MLILFLKMVISTISRPSNSTEHLRKSAFVMMSLAEFESLRVREADFQEWGEIEIPEAILKQEMSKDGDEEERERNVIEF